MFSKKNKRRLRIGQQVFYWSATGNDGWISLTVMTEVPSSPRLSCMFDYHHETSEEQRADGSRVVHARNQFVVTPAVVRKVIDYALARGWKPFEPGSDLNLRRVDDVIDLGLDVNRVDVIKAAKVRAT